MTQNLDKSRLEEGLRQLHISFSEEQISKLLDYYVMVVEKNKVMNLTAITDYDEFVEKHFLDSLSLYLIMNLNDSKKVLDLGTGAGFPGIPLKILFPNLNLTLMDSLNKRISFLREVIDDLQLKNITAIHGRAEEAARQKEYREQFDLCVSRAVANISTLSEYCLPFVKPGGCFVSYKAGDVDDEIASAQNAVSVLGGRISEVYPFVLPGTDLERTFIKIEKVKKTPRVYPRKAGTPSKNPLK